MDQRSIVDEAKRLLRSQMRRARASIPDRDQRSALIWVEVARICEEAAARRSSDRALHVFVFFGVGTEPETAGLVELLKARGHHPLLPRVEGDEIVAVPYVTGDPLVIGAFGIPEPTGRSHEPKSIDVVIVPGLAFTLDGRRLGQGGGFYDRYLATVRPDCVSIGVCFREQIVDDVPTEVHDRKLSVVLFDPVPE